MQQTDSPNQTKGEGFLTNVSGKKPAPQTPAQAFSDFLISVFYALLRFAAGLLLHPYQTMQLLVQEEVFVWLAFLPMLILGFLTLVWKTTLEPVTRLVEILLCGGGQGVWLDGGVWFPLVITWVVVFCLYWLLLLI